jgi:hypothetical protein
VRDYGLGLNEQDIFEVYSQYGTSTKRDSNDVVGMLGLGCKSALTYTDQFTLTGIKDGIRSEVLIGRDEDGGGSMTVVYSEPTDEENGVEVVIPAKKGNSFEGKAQRFFGFWQKGTVEVDGKAPKAHDGLWITDDMFISDDIGASYIVMGNVPYPVEEKKQEDRYTRHTNWLGLKTYGYSRDAGPFYVKFAKIGDVNFTPSREALQMNKRTTEYVAATEEGGRNALRDSIFKQIADAKTAKDAQTLYRKAKRYGVKDVPVWKGRNVLLSLERPVPYNGSTTGWLAASVQTYGRRRKTGEWVSSVSLVEDDAKTTHYFYNFDGKELTSTKRAKLDLWYQQQGITPPGGWIFVTDLSTDEVFWLSGQTVQDFTPINDVKLPKSGGPKSGRISGSYDAIDNGDYSTVQAATIDITRLVLYYEGNRYLAANSNPIYRGILPDDALIICLPANRAAKFKRDFPTVRSVQDYADEVVKNYLKAIPKKVKEALAVRHHESIRTLQSMDEAFVNDPALKEAIQRAHFVNDASVTVVYKKLQNWGENYRVNEFVKVTDVTLAYPLLSAWSSIPVTAKDHAYLYVNAAYAANLKESA